MHISIKKESIGSTRLVILSALNVEVNSTNKEKIEEQLRQYAFDNLLDKREGHLYRGWYEDTASVVIIEDVNVLKEDIVAI